MQDIINKKGENKSVVPKRPLSFVIVLFDLEMSLLNCIDKRIQLI